MGGQATFDTSIETLGQIQQHVQTMRRKAVRAAEQIDIERGSILRITVARKITRAKARKTIERMFMKDKSVARLLKSRADNFPSIPARRGGRIWVKHPNKVHPQLNVGDSAVIVATTDHIRGIHSVKDMIFVKKLSSNSPPIATTPQSVVPFFPHNTTGPIMGGDEMESIYDDNKNSAFTSHLLPSAPIQHLRMPVTIIQQVLHWRLTDKESIDVIGLIKSGQVSQVFVDRKDPPTATDDEIISGATELFNRIATLRTLFGPIVVGPVIDGQDKALMVRLADRMISSTDFTFEQFCKDVEQDEAFAQAVADRKTLSKQLPIPPLA